MLSNHGSIVCRHHSFRQRARHRALTPGNGTSGSPPARRSMSSACSGLIGPLRLQRSQHFGCPCFRAFFTLVSVGKVIPPQFPQMDSHGELTSEYGGIGVSPRSAISEHTSSSVFFCAPLHGWHGLWRDLGEQKLPYIGCPDFLHRAASGPWFISSREWDGRYPSSGTGVFLSNFWVKRCRHSSLQA